MIQLFNNKTEHHRTENMATKSTLIIQKMKFLLFLKEFPRVQPSGHCYSCFILTIYQTPKQSFLLEDDTDMFF